MFLLLPITNYLCKIIIFHAIIYIVAFIIRAVTVFIILFWLRVSAYDKHNVKQTLNVNQGSVWPG